MNKAGAAAFSNHFEFRTAWKQMNLEGGVVDVNIMHVGPARMVARDTNQHRMPREGKSNQAASHWGR